MDGEFDETGGIRGKDVKAIIEIEDLTTGQTWTSNDTNLADHRDFRICLDLVLSKLDSSKALPGS